MAHAYWIAQCPAICDGENGIIAFCEDQMAPPYRFAWDYFVVGCSRSRGKEINPALAFVDKRGCPAYFMRAKSIDIKASRKALKNVRGSVRDGGNMNEIYYGQDAKNKPIRDPAVWLAKVAVETPMAMIAMLDAHH